MPAVLARTVAALVVVALGLGTPPPALAAPAELEQARERRSELESRLEKTVGELEETTARIEEARRAQESLLSEVEALEAAAARASLVLELVVTAAYKQRRDGLAALLRADDAGEALERARVLSGLHRTDREAIERAVAARRGLHARRERLAELVLQLEADEAHLSQLRAQLDSAFADARSREEELASRSRRQRQVSRSRQTGVYACLFTPPFSYRDTWGAPRSGGRRHKGVDVFAPMGHPVYAFTNGVIARHSSSRLGGLGLYLRGDDGNVYYYAHLQRILPGYRPGRRVEAGELIAGNGASGNAWSGAPHVHFEVHPGGGAPVNPTAFVNAACR